MVDHLHLSDDVILTLLDKAELEIPNNLGEHLSTCQHCQKRLERMAAERESWSIAKNCLTHVDARGNVCSVAPILESFEWRTDCDESMVRQLLDTPTHPEMLGRLGRYEVESVIGTGGMGIVFRAHDTELHRPVAIKMLAPHLSGSGSARSRFAREARAAAAIVNDHVVPIHNVETNHARPYLVMQYIAGDSLQARLDREGQLELSEILRIGMQVAKGLAAAHAQGLIHRDVKPSNILLDENVSRALLTDFGLARTQDDACLTRSGFHPGTPHYMSPEQVRGEDLDGRSDLFGLGCVLYSLCTGRPPFRAESGYAVMRRITDETPRSICEQNSDIPNWLERIVLRLLEKDRANRFQSATEVAEMLEQCLAHVQKPNMNDLPLIDDLNSKDQTSPRRGLASRLTVGIAILFIVLVGVPILQVFNTSQTVSPRNVIVLEDDTPSSAAMATDLDADARQAMSTHQNRLVWTNHFKFDSIRRYTHKEAGRVEERSTMASDGMRFVHRQESLRLDQPADFFGRSLTSFALYTGDSFMGGTCLTGQPMKTGGYSPQNAEEHAWGMRERTCMMLEGYRAGNAGQTILELLLKSKALDVKKEKIGEVDCFRIKNRDEWGTNVAWIEAKGKNRLLQWESRKERGNKFSRSRQGEHRDTSNYESSGVRITGIEYREFDGTPIAIRGTYVRFDTPNGGQETVSFMEMERLNIDLRPDFSDDSIFDPLYSEGARITDLDGTDPDKHFWWRNGQLVASDQIKTAKQIASNESPLTVEIAVAQVGESQSTKSPIASKKVSVLGLVLKPDGSSADGAIVRVAAPVFGDMRSVLGKDFESPITEVIADSQGKFEISIDSEPYGNFPTKGTRWEGFWKKSVICATMPGFAGQFRKYEEVERADFVVLRLVEDTPIHGRVVDLEGRPISGVAIELKGILASSNETLDAWLNAVRTGVSDWQAEKEIPRQIETRLLGVPTSVTTDHDGRFSIKGVGQERCLPLQIHGNGVAFDEFKVATRSMNPLNRNAIGQIDIQESIYGVEFTYVGQPSRTVHGTVTDAKTGKPLAGVDVGFETISGNTTSGRWLLPTKSDALGQFRIEGMPKGKGNRLMLLPSDDQPYFMREIDVIDSEGMGPVAMDIGLDRGIWIEGKVIDKNSREPVAGVRLHYLPFLTNKFANELPEFDLVTVDGQQDRYQTDLKGNYRLVGLPGPAVVGVESLHKLYLSGIGYNTLTVPKDRNGALTYRNPFSPRPNYPDSMSEIDPKADAERVQLDFELFSGQTIQVSAVDESSDWLTGAF